MSFQVATRPFSIFPLPHQSRQSKFIGRFSDRHHHQPPTQSGRDPINLCPASISANFIHLPNPLLPHRPKLANLASHRHRRRLRLENLRSSQSLMISKSLISTTFDHHHPYLNFDFQTTDPWPVRP